MGLARIGGQPADRLGHVPVRAEQIRTQVADGVRLVTGAKDLDDAELAADCFIFRIGKHQPDPMVAQRITGCRADPPRSIHPQVGVHCDVTVDPDEQMLATGQRFDHGPPGEVGGGEPRHPEVTADEHPVGQGVM